MGAGRGGEVVYRDDGFECGRGEQEDGAAVGCLVSNTYDATAIAAISGEVRQHDASYGTAFAYRGNVTGVTSPGTVASFGYDIGGNRVTSTVNGVTATSGYQQGTNWAAPGSLTANGLTSEMEWSGFLGLTQNSGPNGDVSGTVFDSFARPQTSTAATGAVTTYAYAVGAPWTVTATVNGRWTRKTLDGFGRVVKAEAGHGGTTVSVVETEYDACACSATGKVKRVSMPRRRLRGRRHGRSTGPTPWGERRA